MSVIKLKLITNHLLAENEASISVTSKSATGQDLDTFPPISHSHNKSAQDQSKIILAPPYLSFCFRLSLIRATGPADRGHLHFASSYSTLPTSLDRRYLSSLRTFSRDLVAVRNRPNRCLYFIHLFIDGFHLHMYAEQQHVTSKSPAYTADSRTLWNHFITQM
jgi:hypothetical protein